MLTLDHITAALIVSNRHSVQQSWIPLAVALFSQIFPDLPVLLGGPGTIEYLAHRKYTTTLILAPIYSAIPILILMLFLKKTELNISKLYLLSITSYIIHILLDLFNPYGTQLFYPISNNVYSLDIFFALDPLYLSTSIVILIAWASYYIRTKRNLRGIWLHGLLSLYLVYFVFTLIIKTMNAAEFKSYLLENKIDCTYVKTIPRPFCGWKGIAENKDLYLVLYKDNGVVKSIKYGRDIEIPQSIKEDADYKAFMDYARFPAVLEKDSIIVITNLTYTTDTYRLEYQLDSMEQIISSSITSFDLEDNIY